MKNIELGNAREEDINELSSIIQEAEVKKLLQTFLTLSEVTRINCTFLKEHLKINKTAARVINDAGILNPSIGMLLLHQELQRKPKVDLQSWWKDEVKTRFNKMQALLIQCLEQMKDHGDEVDAIFSKLLCKAIDLKKKSTT